MGHPLAFIPGADLSYKIIFSASWYDYEEGWWMFILEKDGQYFEVGNSHLMFGKNHPDIWNPELITSDDALIEMLEYVEFENTDDYWC